MSKAALASREAARPEFPIVYAMELDCPGGWGGYGHGDLLLFNTLDEPVTGDIVCVHFKDGRQACMLELTLCMMDGCWERMPYVEHTESTALATVVGKIFGTDRTVCLRLDTLRGVHKCDGLHQRAAS